MEAQMSNGCASAGEYSRKKKQKPGGLATVYEKYNDLPGLARLRKFSISGEAGSASNVPVSDKSEENSELGEPGRDGQPLTQSTFNENIKSRNSEVKGTASQIADEWIDNYEPGVHITLRALRDGSRDIKRIQFSRRRFREHDAEAWWLENREKVYRNYNVVQR
ncbi:UNVERIFIED_CONTAM: PH, RCC1 and FYVE domains-containing protein 1 [Sesamum radiatum]|uniref:PH, RCC1 and FYVE domains-containing protein 1 n=1 Tax=Sesamum radiatum TaxID=300843 RepID=A0AAW2JYZ1_SESRA